MKVNIEIDMTPDEARRMMGLPDVTALQASMMGEVEKRMRAAMDTSDPDAMLKAWMGPGMQGFEAFQRYLWDAAGRIASSGGSTPTKTSKPERA